MSEKIQTVELGDVQGIVLSGYRLLPWARFALVEITDPPRAKAWLAALPVTSALVEVTKGSVAVNVGFTCAGLRRLGLDEDRVHGFSEAFRGGPLGRYLALEDLERGHPRNWAWGSRDGERLHLVVLLYAGEKAARDRLDELTLGAANESITVLHRLDSWVAAHEEHRYREHFGFQDGFAQPYIAYADGTADRSGALRQGTSDALDNTVAPGEFLLGYRDELGGVVRGPTAPWNRAALDLARNGSYAVLRQLRQYVFAFWKFVQAQGSPDELVLRAAQMVGRWPSGTPLPLAPHTDNPLLGRVNDFGFRDQTGAVGRTCPLGAHIRRANPRDSLRSFGTAAASMASVNTHRLIRRGRPYGKPLDESMDPEAFLRAPEGDKEDRGLLFLVFNADLERQFEFVQRNWINGSLFATPGEVDPMVGSQERGNRTFTVGGTPPRRCRNLPDFVTVCGATYLFVPGLTSLRCLAAL